MSIYDKQQIYASGRSRKRIGCIKILQKLNAELKSRGFLTVSGHVNKQYFLERSYETAKQNSIDTSGTLQWNNSNEISLFTSFAYYDFRTSEMQEGHYEQVEKQAQTSKKHA